LGVWYCQFRSSRNQFNRLITNLPCSTGWFDVQDYFSGFSLSGGCGNLPAVPTVAIAANPNGSITAGTSVTFTATPTNGGTTPAYQWKKNGSDVGTNSATYTDAALANGDVISCVMTSSDPCASPTTATSNDITLTITTGQCNSTIQWPTTTVVSNNSGALQTIDLCVKDGEFSVISGIQAGSVYAIGMSLATGYITVKTGSADATGTVIAQGTQPLTFAPSTSSNIFCVVQHRCFLRNCISMSY
jgi:hypothetical protein